MPAPLINRKDVTTSILPLTIPATELFDGDDGPWPSFNLSIGTPAQVIRVFPGTSQNSIWAVLSGGCTVQVPDPCAYNRGFLFVPSVSSTYEEIDQGKEQSLDYGAAQILGYNGSAVAGYDTVGFGSTSIAHQVVEGYTALFPFIGVIGLSVDPVNISTGSESTSLLTNLKSQNLIPSLSFSYTAGARYHVYPTWGSLTLGGYDANQLEFNGTGDITFPIRTELSEQFLVGLQYFYTDLNGGETLLPTSIYANVDSLVPEFWLPVEACVKFEQAFNLTWNDTAQLYTLDNATRSSLLAANPNFTMFIAPTLSDQITVAITLPYGAFDGFATPPFTDSDLWYFPLKRAQNESQYLLGRAFLQEAVLVVDHERSNFTLFQVIHTNDEPDLVTIEPVASLQKSSSLSGGAIAGIVIGAVIGTALIVAILLFLLRRHKKTVFSKSKPRIKESHEEDAPAATGTELDAVRTERIELPTHEAAIELPVTPVELDSTPILTSPNHRIHGLEEPPIAEKTWESSSTEPTLPAYSPRGYATGADAQSPTTPHAMHDAPAMEALRRTWSWASEITEP